LPNAASLAIIVLRQYALPDCQHVAEPGGRRHEELLDGRSAALPCCPFARRPRCHFFVMSHCWQLPSLGILHCQIASKLCGQVNGAMQDCQIAVLLSLQDAILPYLWLAAL